MAAPPPDYHAIALQKARQYGLGDWFATQIGAESNFRPDAHSSAGADGIAQFIPSTAKAYGVNTRDPISSLDGAARYDRDLLKKYGSVERALSAYNSGRPDAYKDPNFAGGQTYDYVRKILGGSTGATPNLASAAGAQRPATSPAPAVAAAAAAPPPDFRPQLAQQLAAAAGSPTNDLSSFYATLTKALQARTAAEQPQPSLGPLPAPTGQTAPIHPLPLKHGQVLGNTAGENPGFLSALAELAAFEHAPVSINSGYRSTQKQAQLYANRASNPNPVAKPGTSLHEKGLAADGTIGGVPIGTLPDALLARFGLARVPGDPVHVQVRR